MKKVLLAIGVMLAVAGSSISIAHAEEPHSAGSVVVDNKGTVYLIMQFGGPGAENVKAPYASAQAFLSYKYNSWSRVQKANSADLALPDWAGINGPEYAYTREGSLINDHGTIYLVSGSGRTGFTSEAVFKGLGYTYANVYNGDTSYMVTQSPVSSSNVKHPDGSLVNDNGTLYIINNDTKLGVPSMKVLESWGYWLSDVVPANNFDRALNAQVMEERKAQDFSIMYRYQ